MVKVGYKVIFNPFKGVNVSGFSNKIHRNVTGKVVEVHEDHQWFGVEYELAEGVTMRTSFKFADIGGDVKVYDSRGSSIETCVCCGDIIPEGRHVCVNCENSVKGEKHA